MKSLLVGLVFTATALVIAAPVEAKGCIKGAVVGAVVGHIAGHGKIGAAAGCAIGHHRASKKDKAADVKSEAK